MTTQIIAAHIGGYPRIGEDKDRQRHRRALAHFQKGDLSKHAFRDVEQSVIQEIIREQIDAGLDEVTDGLVSWNDPISNICNKFQGFKHAGLIRFFDTNFYFRTSVLTQKPKQKRPLILPEYEFAQKASNKPVRVVLPGPYTLAALTQSTYKPLSSFKSRVQFFSETLRQEVISLVSNGAKIIQFDEPAIFSHPEQIKLLPSALETITREAPQARFILAAYFSPLTKWIDFLLSLPVDVLNLDFTYDGKTLLSKLHKSKTKKSIGFGFVDSRNTRMEPIDTILKSLLTWISETNPTLCTITPSASLEFLPRQAAFEKLKLVGQIKNELITKVTNGVKVH